VDRYGVKGVRLWGVEVDSYGEKVYGYGEKVYGYGVYSIEKCTNIS
jgi:hypothetical protein